MSTVVVGPHSRVHCLASAPEDVKTYAVILTAEEAREMATTRVFRCGRSGCDAVVFFRQGEERAPHFYHSGEAFGGCDELKGSAGAWHLRMQFEVFQHAFSQEWRLQGAIADVVIQRKNSKNKFAVEVQHSPIAAETVMARHAAHQEAGLMGTVWIVDGEAFKSKNRRIHTSWVIDLLKACMTTPGGYPCTVLVYKDRRAAGGTETVSVIESVELGHENDGRQYAVANLAKQEGRPVRFSMEALSFLAEGPKRSQVVPIEFAHLQRLLDSLPIRRVKDAAKVRAYAAHMAAA